MKILRRIIYIIAALGIGAMMIAILAKISFLVYNPDILLSIPGKDETWMGVWASYSGTMATLLVAFLTWKNSSAIEKLQKEYYELDTNANLRLSDISILPIVKENGVLNQYRIEIVFDNVAKCLFSDMTIPSSNIMVTIGKTSSNLKISECTYFLRVNQSVLRFQVEIADNDLSMKKAFAGFCYYYSQFSPEVSKMNLKMNIKIQFELEKKEKCMEKLFKWEKKEKCMEKQFEATLSPTPVIKRKKDFNIVEDKYLVEAYAVCAEDYKLSNNLSRL